MMKVTLRRRWDWYAVLLLFAIVSLAVGRLSMTNWTRELGYVETAAVLGVILGVALGYSRFKRRHVGWLALGFTLIVVPWQMAHVISVQTTIQGILSQEAIRLGFALQQLVAGKPVYDPIFFAALISSIYWFIGLFCGYQLIRGANLLAILLPPTIPALIVQYYDGSQVDSIWLIALYFILVLLLVGRVNILHSREKWESKRVFTGSEPEFDLSKSVFVAAAVVVMFSWILPTPSAALPIAARIWQQINEPHKSLDDWINQTRDVLRTGPGNGLEAYGNTLNLGLSASQGTKTVFSVTPLRILSAELATKPGVFVGEVDFPRYYWQMRIYDTYEDGNWSNAPQNWSRGFSPDNGDLPVSISAIAQTASFDFHWKGNSSVLLVAPSQPIWVSQAGSIQYKDAATGQIDMTSWHIDPWLEAGDDYSARAQLLNPTVNALRSAGASYPQWVTERYLQIPAAFSDDIRALASDLTASQPTPYDKTSAITDYLRREIKYSPNVAAPPPGIDPLDWFLFTWKSGYCNYYAAVEVLMLRSVGIPARLAVGYAEGQRESDGTFTVRERDAHAWPQVYFPEIGWVDFEPTASQPTLARPAGSVGKNDPSMPTDGEQAPNLPPQRPQDDPNFPNRSIPYRSIGVWVIILVIVFAAGYGVWFLNRKKAFGQRIPQFVRVFYQHYGLAIPIWLERWERWSNLTLVERSFHTINQSLAWLGKPQPPHATPAERAELLKTFLPSVAQEISTLKEQHEQTLFGPIPGDSAKALHAAWMIRYQTARAILRRFIGVKNE